MKHVIAQIQRAIRTGGKTRYRLWKETGVDQGQMSRFISQGTGLSIEAMEKIADCLGLEIRVVPKRDGRKGR